MRRLIFIVGALAAVVAAAVAAAWAANWELAFKERVTLAALDIAPPGLRARLPRDPAVVHAALLEAATLTRNGKRDPEEHLAQVRQMLKKPDAPPERLLAELAALATYFMDKTAPEAVRSFFVAVDGSDEIGADRFDGYYYVAHFAPFIEVVKSVVGPTRDSLGKEAGGAGATGSTKTADSVAQMFDLYVNATVDLWASLAKDAEIPFGEMPAAGLRSAPKSGSLVNSGGIFRPTIGLDTGVLTRQMFAEGQKSGALTKLDVGAAGGAKKTSDEFVFDDVSVSGDEAKRKASQLANSDVTVDSRGMDRMSALDDETRAALNKMGIDVGAQRGEFKGTRGGVQPGQVVKAGDIEIKLNNLSTVEIAGRDKRQVYMQLPDVAGSTAGSTGVLNQKAVVAVIGANIGAFKNCFERRLRDIPDLAGRVFVQFTIGVDGAVGDVKLLENTTNDRPFADCLVSHVERLRFPPPKGGEVTFVFPFIFEQAYAM